MKMKKKNESLECKKLKYCINIKAPEYKINLGSFEKKSKKPSSSEKRQSMTVSINISKGFFKCKKAFFTLKVLECNQFINQVEKAEADSLFILGS